MPLKTARLRSLNIYIYIYEENIKNSFSTNGILLCGLKAWSIDDREIVGSCEHGNEYSSYTQCGGNLLCLREHFFLKDRALWM